LLHLPDEHIYLLDAPSFEPCEPVGIGR